MKSIQKKKQSKKVVFLIVLIVLLFTASGAVFYYQTRSNPQPTTTNTTSEETQPSSPNIEAESNDKGSVINPPVNDTTDNNTTTDNVPQAKSISIAINKLEQSNGYVVYRSTVAGADAGTCSATFTNNYGKPVVKNSPMTNMVCEGSVNEMEFDALGTWTLTIRFYNNNTQASDTRKVEIR